jgi:enamine deaminase RidA (YjgF/YER057c/UK114 family)
MRAVVKREIINPPDVWDPDKVGPFVGKGAKEPASWSQISKRGNIAVIAGQVGCTADGEMPGDAYKQLDLVYENLDNCLKAIGATWNDVMHLWFFSTVYDEDYVSYWRKVVKKYIPGPPYPPMSGFGCGRLTWPWQKVEIQALVVTE